MCQHCRARRQKPEAVPSGFSGCGQGRACPLQERPPTCCSTSKVPLVTRSQKRPLARVAEGLVELERRGEREAVTGLKGEGLN